MDNKGKVPAWETVSIFAAIVAVWPSLLRYWAMNHPEVAPRDLPLGSVVNWTSPAWDALAVAAFALMVVVAIRRIRRVRSFRAGEGDSAPPGRNDRREA